MATTPNKDKDYYGILGIKKTRLGGGHPQGVPQTCAQISSRRESRGQVCGGEVQAALRGQRRPQRSQEAQDLRPARLLLGQHRSSGGRSLRARRRLWRRRIRRPGPALAARAPTRQEVPFDFSGFDFTDFSEGAGAAGRRAGSGGGFRDIFSNMFSGGGRQRQCSGPSPAAIWNTRSTSASGRRSAARRCSSPSRVWKSAPTATGKDTSKAPAHVPNVTAKGRSRRRAAA